MSAFQESNCTVGDGCPSHTDTQQSSRFPQDGDHSDTTHRAIREGLSKLCDCRHGTKEGVRDELKGEKTLQPDVSGCDLVGYHVTKKTPTPFEGGV